MGATDCIELPAGNAFYQLQQFQQKHNGWLFGHLGYDLKNETEDIFSAHPDHTCFPDLFFFVPETVLLLKENELHIAAVTPEKANEIFTLVNNNFFQQSSSQKTSINFQPRFSKQTYIETVEKLRSHILRGDCYEINFCQ